MWFVKFMLQKENISAEKFCGFIFFFIPLRCISRRHSIRLSKKMKLRMLFVRINHVKTFVLFYNY